MITQSQFNALAAQGHNRIPLVAQALADLDTPLSLYLKLTQGQSLSFLLESVVGASVSGVTPLSACRPAPCCAPRAPTSRS